MLKLAEYLWLDGAEPTQQIRSKTRVVDLPEDGKVSLTDFPEWGYDGSSTYQADGGDSDLTLRPVSLVRDPLRGDGNYLVMCEVFTGEGEPHVTNTRAMLRRALDSGAAADDPWVGFEQEYALFTDDGPLGWPKNGFPQPQGPFYCGVGADRTFGRSVVEAHTRACLDAGLMIYGINAEVMPGQWEFQVGYRGLDDESADPLSVSDHVQFSRWLLHRIGEDFGVSVNLDPKPVEGDWNGSGAHTNFSTCATRDPQRGLEHIRTAIQALEASHEEHIAEYGYGLAERLTGLHETCSIDEFRGGVADRGASIRIPRQVEERGYGYLEDRRPGSNCDPYSVCRLLVETVCRSAGSRRLARAS